MQICLAITTIFLMNAFYSGSHFYHHDLVFFLIHSGIDRKDKKQLEWSRIQYLKCSSQHFGVDQ